MLCDLNGKIVYEHKIMNERSFAFCVSMSHIYKHFVRHMSLICKKRVSRTSDERTYRNDRSIKNINNWCKSISTKDFCWIIRNWFWVFTNCAEVNIKIGLTHFKDDIFMLSFNTNNHKLSVTHIGNVLQFRI